MKGIGCFVEGGERVCKGITALGHLYATVHTATLHALQYNIIITPVAVFKSTSLLHVRAWWPYILDVHEKNSKQHVSQTYMWPQHTGGVFLTCITRAHIAH